VTALAAVKTSRRRADTRLGPTLSPVHPPVRSTRPVTAAHRAYQATSVATASPEQLVVMLFDGALRFGRRAIAAMHEERFADATQSIGRVSAIVAELNGSLDMEVGGGEIASNLRALYLFCGDHLLRAGLERDPRKVQQVIGLLGDLREAFAHAAREVRAA
jgi:flagellar protein FliS